MRMRYLYIAAVAYGCLASGHSQKAGSASASGACSVAHNGNGDSITIQHCGIGNDQAKKIIQMLNAVLKSGDKALISSKLDELLAVASKPFETQNCVGSACAQGVGAQATFNQLGAPKLVLTEAQQKTVHDAMKPFTGESIYVFAHNATDDSANYARRLADAFRMAEMKVVGPIFGTAIGMGPIPAGCSIEYGRNRVSAARVLVNALLDARIVSEPVNVVSIAGDASKEWLQITIAPNR